MAFIKTAERRARILAMLQGQAVPLSATFLAGELRVSRQAIVGDIALLRAEGNDIVATARGYQLARSLSTGRYVGTIACRHSMEDTRLELQTIVDYGGVVADVTVEHELYGEITGQLGIATRDDVEDFMRRLEERQVRLLSDLTGGVHNHTVLCGGKREFDRIMEELARRSLLYREE